MLDTHTYKGDCVWCVVCVCVRYVLGTRGDSIIYIRHIVYYSNVYIYTRLFDR